MRVAWLFVERCIVMRRMYRLVLAVYIALGHANTTMASSHTVESFLALRQECVWIQSCFNTFYTLFESGAEALTVLDQSAPAFFRDINLILQEHFMLQVCRVTDPASSNGRENLTIKNLNLALESEGLLSPEIARHSERIHAYRAFVVDGRNQIISHADKAKILSRTESESHAKSDVEDFFDALYCYVDLVGEAVGVGPLDFKYTDSEGDAEALISCLKRGLTIPSSGPPTASG